MIFFWFGEEGSDESISASEATDGAAFDLILIICIDCIAGPHHMRHVKMSLQLPTMESSHCPATIPCSNPVVSSDRSREEVSPAEAVTNEA